MYLYSILCWSCLISLIFFRLDPPSNFSVLIWEIKVPRNFGNTSPSQTAAWSTCWSNQGTYYTICQVTDNYPCHSPNHTPTTPKSKMPVKPHTNIFYGQYHLWYLFLTLWNLSYSTFQPHIWSLTIHYVHDTYTHKYINKDTNLMYILLNVLH